MAYQIRKYRILYFLTFFQIGRLMTWDRVGRYRWLSGASLMLLLADLTLNSIFQVFSHNTLLALLVYM